MSDDLRRKFSALKIKLRNFVDKNINMRYNLSHQIIGLNVSIFGLSKISGRHLNKFMNLFTVQRHSRNPFSYLLSCFTHMDLFHLGMNCLAISSLVNLFQRMYGYDHALWVFLTTGTVGAILTKMVFDMKWYNKRKSVIFVFEIGRFTYYNEI